MTEDIRKELEESASLGAEARESGKYGLYWLAITPDRIARWREAFDAQAEELRLLRAIVQRIGPYNPRTGTCRVCQTDVCAQHADGCFFASLDALRARKEKQGE